jgi:3-isopropylmalate/(R)-2-methylmalate dehydratase small subunit
MTPSMRTPITTVAARYVVLPSANIDTDQIIPARYLKKTDRSGLGPHAFHDWRYRADGTLNPDFALNRAEAQDARILVAGRNFGCGSSREHAVWALMAAGFEAVISSDFADIFRGNALGNGLLPVQVDEDVAGYLVMLASRDVGPVLSIDLAAQALSLPNGNSVQFPIPPFAKHCLQRGIDEFEFLLGAQPEIAEYEHRRPPVSIAE